MMGELQLEVENAKELLAKILLQCDGYNASVIMTAFQIAMIYIVKNVNHGDKNESLSDLDSIFDYMLNNYDMISQCDLGELGLDSETYIKH